MLEISVKSGLEVRFFDFSFDGKKWVCWFYESIDVTAMVVASVEKSKAK